MAVAGRVEAQLEEEAGRYFAEIQRRGGVFHVQSCRNFEQGVLALAPLLANCAPREAGNAMPQLHGVLITLYT